MKFALHRPVFKTSKKIFKVDRSFKMKSEVTDRTLTVAEAFGVGIDEEKEQHLYRDFTVEVKPGDIVYITGESGSGKSILLRELINLIRASKSEFDGGVVQDSEFQIDLDEILVDGVGSDVNEALRCLSLAGLNDAFLFVRRFKELSEGQKYRYKVAKMLASGSSVWFLDEFAATLDRETAKIVAFCLQKVARRAGRTVILATSHEDLFDDASPSVYIRKGWGEEVHVEYRSNKVGETCSLMRRVKIREGGIADYNPLSYLHYRAGRPWGIKKIFAAELNRRVIGVIVYSVPPLKAAGRTKFLGYTPKAEEVNRDFLIISRVILHPKYRSIGLGTRLVRETLPLAESKYVEAIAVMARYNPFFNKAGMQEVPVDSTFSTGCQTILDGLKEYGFNPHFCSSIPYNLRLLNQIDEAGYNRFIDCLTGGGKKLFLITGQLYRRKTPHLKDLQRDLRNREFAAKVIRILAFKAQRKKYFVSRI